MTKRQSRRLQTGGTIHRDRILTFTFDGLSFDGYAGDTLASALLANDVRLVGRSFKYHRPRGIMTAGSEEPNALVELRTGGRREPNTRATTTELYDSLIASSQNRWPSLDYDALAINGRLSPLFAAGFYYKTFKWPSAFWERVYEPIIRRAAGLGRAADQSDPDSYERKVAYCDLLIVGAGPSGLSAALSAGRSGARVILAESDFLLGGRLLSDHAMVDQQPGTVWVKKAEEELRSLPKVEILPRTTVFGAYDGGVYGAIERVTDHESYPSQNLVRQRYWKINARRVIMATGATERPIVFPGNDRPGVMMAASVRTYVNRFAVAPGRSFAIFTNNDDGWRTADALMGCGAQVDAIIDSRGEIDPGLIDKARQRQVPIYQGTVMEVAGGRKGIRSISVSTLAGGTKVLPIDCLAVSGGWNPNIGLATHLGNRAAWSEKHVAFLASRLPPGMSSVGAANGIWQLGKCLSDGFQAGIDAVDSSPSKHSQGVPPIADNEAASVSPLWHVTGVGKSFVDFQNDVTSVDVALAQQEGYDSVEHMKRYTTLGMATDQGKTSNVNGLALLAMISGRSIEDTGITTLRPPIEPVAIGAIAGPYGGKHLKPTRLTPSHVWAKEQGAIFVEAGLWLRAQWYPREGESDWLESVNREVRTVRSRVGVCDVSTLGKIDIQGRDAGRFLDCVYTNAFSALPVGRARYGLMLREDGFVLDDGTTARLRDEHFVMTTTTANAARVMQHLEFARQVLWPEFDVCMTSVTEQWAQYTIAGPRSGEVIEALVDLPHLDTVKSLPVLGVAEVSFGDGIAGRIFRISYSGEKSFEIAVPARYGDAAIRAIMSCGAPFGIAPYGTEALGVMRIEKGHVAGNELNGTTTARDLGLNNMMSRKKDFIGRTMAMRPGLLDPDRWELAGFQPVKSRDRIRAGAHFLPLGAAATPESDQGYMTSVAHSPSLGSWIGLGLISRGRSRHGELVRAYDPVRGGDCVVRIVNPVFYDPTGDRQRG